MVLLINLAEEFYSLIPSIVVYFLVWSRMENNFDDIVIVTGLVLASYSQGVLATRIF